MGIDPVTHSPRLDLLDLSSLFGSSISHINNNMQHHLNPELLKLATSLFSPNNNNNNSLDNSHNQIISSDVSLSFPQANFLESNNNVDSAYPSNLLHHDLMNTSDYWDADNNNNIGIASTSSPCYVTDQLPTSYYYNNNSNNYYSHHASLVDPPMSETSTFHSNNSSSNTYVNGNNSSTEDERESYVSTNNSVLRFEIPDMLDVNAFV
ncbi:transcription factor MYB102 [Arachis hypogaea]